MINLSRKWKQKRTLILKSSKIELNLPVHIMKKEGLINLTLRDIKGTSHSSRNG